MREIDFTADSPNQLYSILKDLLNQDDSEEIFFENAYLFSRACEALMPLTVNSSNKTRLELLQLALDYHLRLRSGRGRLNPQFQKFALDVLKYEHFKVTEIFFDEKIIVLSNEILKDDLLDVGVKCLERHLSLGNLSEIRIDGEFDELQKFCHKVNRIEGINVLRITEPLGEFLEKLSEEE